MSGRIRQRVDQVSTGDISQVVAGDGLSGGGSSGSVSLAVDVNELTVVTAVAADYIAIEDVGTSEPWDVDLTGDVMLIVGGEHDGVPEAIMEQCDDVVSIPMAGFVPSYNLQAPLAVVALEALRQRRS